MTADDYGQPVQWLGVSYTNYVERKEEKTCLIDPCDYGI